MSDTAVVIPALAAVADMVTDSIGAPSELTATLRLRLLAAIDVVRTPMAHPCLAVTWPS